MKLYVRIALGSNNPPNELFEAMNYALFAGGKRVRPILMRIIANLLGKKKDFVNYPAIAIELVQTSSLILDDLPCMDDANLRRGKPTIHIQYSESTAIFFKLD